jgi:dienelactone hydrolase
LERAGIVRQQIAGAIRLFFGVACIAIACTAAAQEFDIKDGELTVKALNFGAGDHVAIALHGNNGNRSFFTNYANDLVKAGFRVISIQWPGNPPASGIAPLRAAMKLAREQGAKNLSLIGFSKGGELAALFARTQASEEELDTIVLFFVWRRSGYWSGQDEEAFCLQQV